MSLPDPQSLLVFAVEQKVMGSIPAGISDLSLSHSQFFLLLTRCFSLVVVERYRLFAEV